MNSYADALESYLIPAEEGFTDKVKSAVSKVLEVINKLIEKIKSFISWLKTKLSKSEASESADYSSSLQSNIKEMIYAIRDEVDMCRGCCTLIKTPYKDINNNFETFNEAAEKVEEFRDNIYENIRMGKRIMPKDVTAYISALEHEARSLGEIHRDAKSLQNMDVDAEKVFRLTGMVMKLSSHINMSMNIIREACVVNVITPSKYYTQRPDIEK